MKNFSRILKINPKYRHLESQIIALIENFNSQDEALVVGERNTIKTFKLANLTLNIKSFKKPHIFNAWAYKYIRACKAKRSFNNANKLISCGILTPTPVAYVAYYSIFGLTHSYYISVHLQYDFEFRALIHNPKFTDRKLLIQQMAAFTFKLHEHNINFLDHSPGNTLIKKNNKHYDFYLIDLNRMCFEAMNFNKRMHNFRRLWLSKTMIKIMSKTYAQLYNKPFETVYELMLKHSKAFQTKINCKKMRRSGRTYGYKKT